MFNIRGMRLAECRSSVFQAIMTDKDPGFLRSPEMGGDYKVQFKCQSHRKIMMYHDPVDLGGFPFSDKPKCWLLGKLPMLGTGRFFSLWLGFGSVTGGASSKVWILS